MSESLVDCEGLVYIYKARTLEVVALQGLDLHVERGTYRGERPWGRARPPLRSWSSNPK